MELLAVMLLVAGGNLGYWLARPEAWLNMAIGVGLIVIVLLEGPPGA